MTTSRTRPPRSRPVRALAGVFVVAALTLTGCSLPHHKSDDAHPSKPSAGFVEADAALSSYARARAAADATLDSGVLADLEGGSLLDIDESSFTIRRALSISARPFVVDDAATIWSSRFTAYPLWFVALAQLPEQQQQAVFVFSRASSTDPWIVESAPRLAGDTHVPTVDRASDGTVARYVPASKSWSDGTRVDLAATPQEIADDYADVLTHRHSAHADEFVDDSFITQMRELREAQPDEGVRFAQTWTARPVHYVLRLADGGALMLVTLHRVDAFDVGSGNALSFDNSEAGVYLQGKVHRKAKLAYEHQVLMVVPAEGKPLVIGQYGGLVSVKGR